MNIVALSGRPVADLELRHTNDGTPCLTFILAVEREGRRDEADYPVIVAWRDTAEFAVRNIHKGQRIIVHGEIRTRNYRDKDGENRKATEVRANKFEFADSWYRGGADDESKAEEEQNL